MLALVTLFMWIQFKIGSLRKLFNVDPVSVGQRLYEKGMQSHERCFTDIHGVYIRLAKCDCKCIASSTRKATNWNSNSTQTISECAPQKHPKANSASGLIAKFHGRTHRPIAYVLSVLSGFSRPISLSTVTNQPPHHVRKRPSFMSAGSGPRSMLLLLSDGQKYTVMEKKQRRRHFGWGRPTDALLHFVQLRIPVREEKRIPFSSAETNSS